MKKYNLFIMLSVLAFAWGCGDDDDSDNPVQPVLTQGTDQRPSWASPDYSQFENTMAMQFQLQEQLNNYVSEQDLLCATINGEVRAVSEPQDSEGQIYFPLVIAANSTDGMVSVSYYCDQLHRIFTITDWRQFDTSIPPTNDGEPYILEFITTEQQ